VASVRSAILAQLDEWDALPWECIRLAVRALRVVLDAHQPAECDGWFRCGGMSAAGGGADCPTVLAIAKAMDVTAGEGAGDG
jgi:hypothetical protein